MKKSYASRPASNSLRQKSSSSIGDRVFARNLSRARQSMSNAHPKPGRDSSSALGPKPPASLRALRSRWSAALALAEQRVRDGGPLELGRRTLREAEAALPDGSIRELSWYWVLQALYQYVHIFVRQVLGIGMFRFSTKVRCIG